MMGSTGAYFGFALLLAALYANLYADGDRQAGWPVSSGRIRSSPSPARAWPWTGP